MTLDVLDRFPTRVSHDAARVARTDPTVWGDVDGPISADLLASHAADGFSVHEQLFTPNEIEAYSVAARLLSDSPALTGNPRVVREKASPQVRSVFEVHKLSETMAHLVADPRLVERAQQILGSEVYVHQSRVNFMPAFSGSGFYWHSDFETWHAEDGMPSPRAVSVSVAMTDNFAFNGSLMVIPGSHREFIPCLGETPEDNFRKSLREQVIGVPSEQDLTNLANHHGISQFTGAAGSVLFFDCNLMHGSGSNITPYSRSNIFIVYNSVENSLVEPFAAPTPRPEYIAARERTYP